MLRFLFNIQGSSAPVSQITGEILLPVIIVAFLAVLAINIKRKNGTIKTLFWLAFVLYCSALIELLFFPIPYKPSEFAAVRYFSQPIANVVPFKEIFSTSPSIIMRNLIGNLIIFIPLGFSLPIIMKTTTRTRVFLSIIIVAALVVELLQFVGSFLVFNLDWKIVDVDDCIMNCVGGATGLGLYFLILKATARPKVELEETQEQ